MGLWGCSHRPRWPLGRRGLDNSSGDTGWGLKDMVSGPPRSLLGWGHWGRGPGGRGGRPGQGGGDERRHQSASQRKATDKRNRLREVDAAARPDGIPAGGSQSCRLGRDFWLILLVVGWSGGPSRKRCRTEGSVALFMPQPPAFCPQRLTGSGVPSFQASETHHQLPERKHQ